MRLLSLLTVAVLAASPSARAVSPELVTRQVFAQSSAPSVVACDSALLAVAKVAETPSFTKAREEALTACSRLFKQPACAKAVKEAGASTQWPGGLSACCVAYPAARGGFCDHDEPLLTRQDAISAVSVMFQHILTAEHELSDEQLRRLVLSLGPLVVQPGVEIPAHVRTPTPICELAVNPAGRFVYVYFPDGKVHGNRVSPQPRADQLDAIAEKLAGCVAWLRDGGPSSSRRRWVDGLRKRGLKVYVGDEMPPARSQPL